MEKPQLNIKAQEIPMTTNMKSRSVPTETIDFDMYKPRRWGAPYIPIADEEQELEQFVLSEDPNTHYMITSEKGMGKTLLVYHIACKNDIPIIMLSCSSATKEGDLLGRVQVDTEGSYFQLGVLPKAVELANRSGRCILYLDELNALDEQMQKILNSLLDERRSVIANGREYIVKKDCKLQAIATTNPLGLGTNTIIEDLKSRFPFGKEWIYSSEHYKVFKWTMPADLKERFIKFTEDLRSLRIRDSMSYSLSTRDLKAINTCYDIAVAKYKDEEAIIRMVLNTCVINHKFDTYEERKAVKELAYDVFGVRI